MSGLTRTAACQGGYLEISRPFRCLGDVCACPFGRLSWHRQRPQRKDAYADYCNYANPGCAFAL
jgi:hypothetical protein